jgi:hypothetical protein
MANEGENNEGGKHPETVPWSQYVGTKESLGSKLDAANAKVSSLEEQVKTAVKPEDHNRVVAELNTLKATHESVSKELNTIKDASIAEKRTALVTSGIPEDKVKSMSAIELNAALLVINSLPGGNKVPVPRADLGNGSTAPPPTKDPMERSRRAYEGKK